MAVTPTVTAVANANTVFFMHVSFPVVFRTQTGGQGDGF
jgi:hypothetical protein